MSKLSRQAQKGLDELRKQYPQFHRSLEELEWLRAEAARYHTVQKIMFDALYSASREPK